MNERTKGAGRPGVFLSHNQRDKPFAKKLARDLEKRGARVWFDTVEMRVGESILDKIAQGIQSCDFLAVILSPSAVESHWVQTELRLAMTHELNLGRIKVLPLLYQDCQVPPYLADKLYADFRRDEQYGEALESVLLALGFSSRRGNPEPAVAAEASHEAEPAVDKPPAYAILSVGPELYAWHCLALAGIPFGFAGGKLAPGADFNYTVGVLSWLFGMILLGYCYSKFDNGFLATVVLAPSFGMIRYLSSLSAGEAISIGALVGIYLLGCYWIVMTFFVAISCEDVVVRRSSLAFRLWTVINPETGEKPLKPRSSPPPGPGACRREP